MTEDRLRMNYGYVLLVCIAALGFALALGKVHEETSFGLRELILILGMLASQWAGWAFAGSRGKQAEPVPFPEPAEPKAKAA